MQVSTHDVFRKQNTAVITGAASGIGRYASLACAMKGMHVWMIDKDEADLKQAKEMVLDKVGKAHLDQKIKAIVAHVGDESNMKFVSDIVFNSPTTSSVNFLMNNAAMAIGGNAVDTPMKDFGDMMKTNLYGCIHTCQNFIPRMKEKGQPGLIVNTGSKQGITCPPGNLTYNVTKAALKTWTEGLEHELMMERVDKGGKLQAALLVPGWTNTSIKMKELRDRAERSGNKGFKYESMKTVMTNEEYPADGAWMPKEVFDYMLKKLGEGSFYIICPDNEVDSHTDKVRMTWAMQDITEDRAPLSRWHPEWDSEYKKYLHEQSKLNPQKNTWLRNG